MADYDSSLPIRTETDGDAVVKIVDLAGSNLWNIDSNNIGQVNLNDGTNSLVIGATGGIAISIPAGEKIIVTDGTEDLLITPTGTIGIGDGTNDLAIGSNGEVTSIVTDGTDTWDIDSNGVGQVNLNDGTDALDINSDGSINVSIVDAVQGDEVHEYAVVVAGVPGTINTVVDYTVTAGKTLQLKAAQASFSGKGKAELQVGPASSEVTKAVWFVSTSSGVAEMIFPQPIEVAAGDKVLLKLTNRDKQNADVYGFINGNEI